jgi:hypothetical protein
MKRVLSPHNKLIFDEVPVRNEGGSLISHRFLSRA